MICDQTIVLTGVRSRQDYPEKLRRIKFHDPDTGNTSDYQQFRLTGVDHCDLYRCRWQVELFFKWIKRNLRIKSFYGTSENAVKSQIWIAVSVYVIVAIMKNSSIFRTVSTLCSRF